MIRFRWLGLFCMVVGGLACSTAPEGPVLETAKEPPAPHYVGLEIPPMPKGHETELGYLLGPEEEGRYSIEVVKAGSKKLVWMGSLLFHDKKGRAHWKIIAALPPRTLPEGYRFSGGNCRHLNRVQPGIVAILKRENKNTVDRVHQAWRADPTRARFEPLPIEEIRCTHEEGHQ